MNSSRSGKYVPVLALGILAGVVAAAFALWSFTARSANARAAELVTAHRARVRTAASVGARRLGARLEALRRAEAERPFEHYASSAASPLARAGGDHLIDAYFQMDECCQTTVPGRLTSTPAGDVDSRSGRFLLDELTPLARLCENRTWDPYENREDPPGGRIELIDGRVYRESLQPSAALRSGRRHDADDGARIRVEIGELAWRAQPIGGVTQLVAIRRVVLPDGVWTQGFVISTPALRELLGEGMLPLVLTFGPGDGNGFDVGLPGIDLQIGIDAARLDAETAEPVQRLISAARFDSRLGMALVLLAGLSLVALSDQVERRVRERKNLLAWVAAEIARPLRLAREAADRIADNPEDLAAVQESAATAQHQLERLHNIVDTALLGNEAAGSPRTSLTPADLAIEVRRAIDDIAAGIHESGASIELKVDENLPAVRFDPDAVRRLVRALVDNAEKYSRFCLDRSILVELSRVGSEVLLSVSDRGPGLPERVRARLARSFERGSTGLEAVAGYGLADVDRIVRLHGGRVGWDDRSGGGTTFVVSFPLDEGAEELAPKAKAAPETVIS